MSGALEVVRPERQMSHSRDSHEHAVSKGIAPISKKEEVPLVGLLHPGAVVVSARMIAPPEVLRGEGQPFGDWSILRAVDALDLEEDLRRAGWQFFVMEPAVHAWGVGRDANAALARALQKAVSVVEGENLNALEIRKVGFRRVLGMSRVRLSAYARQVQCSREYSYGGCAPVFRPAPDQGRNSNHASKEHRDN